MEGAPQGTGRYRADRHPGGRTGARLSVVTGGRRLERGGQHRILVHKRWQQNADAKSATTPLRLQSANNELDGTLRFYLSRFLHVELNLALQDPRATGGVKAFQLNEHRRVRPQEIHTTSINPGSGRCCASRRSASPKRHVREAGQACAISAIAVFQ